VYENGNSYNDAKEQTNTTRTNANRIKRIELLRKPVSIYGSQAVNPQSCAAKHTLNRAQLNTTAISTRRPARQRSSQTTRHKQPQMCNHGQKSGLQPNAIVKSDKSTNFLYTGQIASMPFQRACSSTKLTNFRNRCAKGYLCA
jgi:hypothetical protein